MDWKHRCAVVIPCLNEAEAIGPLVQQVREHLPVILVVDDGSTDSTAAIAVKAGAEILSHSQSRGKGAALNTGLCEVVARGFDWALLMDGDGQHAPEDIPSLLAAAERTNAALVIGNRMTHTTEMPFSRRATNRLMSGLLSRLTANNLPDTQCGFRLMRLDAWAALKMATSHFEVESEMIVKFLAAGQGVAFAPVQTIYKHSRSKISPLKDGWRWVRWLGRSRIELAGIRNGAGRKD